MYVDVLTVRRRAELTSWSQVDGRLTVHHVVAVSERYRREQRHLAGHVRRRISTPTWHVVDACLVGCRSAGGLMI